MSGIRGYLYRIAFVAMLPLLPATGYAQEATLAGAVMDSSGGVLPGVTVTAIHEASGNTFLAVTDERGAFRLPVRTGRSQARRRAPGSCAGIKRRVELLVGQTAVVTLKWRRPRSGSGHRHRRRAADQHGQFHARQQRRPAADAGAAAQRPELRRPDDAGAGSRQNASSDELGGLGTFQLNVDGLRVTQNQTGGFGQPKYSRDAIAEFEFVTNRFDATQGGSSGTLVNAITKSGTNIALGHLLRLLPRRQLHRQGLRPEPRAAVSGPAVQLDVRRADHARTACTSSPTTSTSASRRPSATRARFRPSTSTIAATRTEKKGGGRVDVQFTPKTRLNVRGNKSLVDMPLRRRATPAAPRGIRRRPSRPNGTAPTSAARSRRFSARARSTSCAAATRATTGSRTRSSPWPDHPYPGLTLRHADHQRCAATPSARRTPSRTRTSGRSTYSFRDNLSSRSTRPAATTSRSAASGSTSRTRSSCASAAWASTTRRAVRFRRTSSSCSRSGTTSPPGTWPRSRRSSAATRSASARCSSTRRSRTRSAWIQDDWHVTSRLTLNLGLRYDLEDGVYAEDDRARSRSCKAGGRTTRTTGARGSAPRSA